MQPRQPGEPADAYINRLEAEIVRRNDLIGWVDAWISNPVGSYSVSALDGLFSMTRDKIASLTSTK